jgi:thioredoxin reductase (NADPH)
VGGDNSAGQAALHLAGYASSVTILIRRASLVSTMSQYLIAQIDDTPNITVRVHSEVVAVEGERWLERAVLRNREGGESETVDTFALFIFIGALPHTDWLGDLVDRDARGYVRTGVTVMQDGRRPSGWTAARDPLWLETNVPGVFAAGDVRQRSIKRIASAVGEGAMAVQFVHQHLSGAVLAPRADADARTAIEPPSEPAQAGADGADGTGSPAPGVTAAGPVSSGAAAHEHARLELPESP